MFFKKFSDEEIVAKRKPTFKKVSSPFNPGLGAALTITALLFPVTVGGGALLGMVIGLAVAGPAGLLSGLLIGGGIGTVPSALALGKAMLTESGDAVANKINRVETKVRERQYNNALSRLEEKYKGDPQAFDKAITEAFRANSARKGRTPLERVSMGKKFRM